MRKGRLNSVDRDGLVHVRLEGCAGLPPIALHVCQDKPPDDAMARVVVNAVVASRPRRWPLTRSPPPQTGQARGRPIRSPWTCTRALTTGPNTRPSSCTRRSIVPRSSSTVIVSARTSSANASARSCMMDSDSSTLSIDTLPDTLRAAHSPVSARRVSSRVSNPGWTPGRARWRSGSARRFGRRPPHASTPHHRAVAASERWLRRPSARSTTRASGPTDEASGLSHEANGAADTFLGLCSQPATV